MEEKYFKTILEEEKSAVIPLFSITQRILYSKILIPYENTIFYDLKKNAKSKFVNVFFSF